MSREWLDNVFVERLWRTLKYEEIYLHVYDSVSFTRVSLGAVFDVLQLPVATVIAGRIDTLSSIGQHFVANPGGGITELEIHHETARNRSDKRKTSIAEDRVTGTSQLPDSETGIPRINSPCRSRPTGM